MDLYLVRHGQTPSNLVHALDTTSPGAPLTQRGREQATALVDTWHAMDLPAPDIVVASPLVRTQQTASPLAKAYGRSINIHSGLREIRAGNLEMHTELGHQRAYVSRMREWMRGNTWTRMPGAEVGFHILGRMKSAITWAEKQVGADATLVMFSHGAVMRFFSAALFSGITSTIAAANPLPNCGIIHASGSFEDGWHADLYASQPVEVFANSSMPRGLAVG